MICRLTSVIFRFEHCIYWLLCNFTHKKICSIFYVMNPSVPLNPCFWSTFLILCHLGMPVSHPMLLQDGGCFIYWFVFCFVFVHLFMFLAWNEAPYFAGFPCSPNPSTPLTPNLDPLPHTHTSDGLRTVLFRNLAVCQGAISEVLYCSGIILSPTSFIRSWGTGVKYGRQVWPWTLALAMVLLQV